nr:unnamed protein product [Callosobruchus chinensis]
MLMTQKMRYVTCKQT